MGPIKQQPPNDSSKIVYLIHFALIIIPFSLRVLFKHPKTMGVLDTAAAAIDDLLNPPKILNLSDYTSEVDIYSPTIFKSISRDRFNTNWNFPSMPSVTTTRQAEYMTLINKPFIFDNEAFKTNDFAATSLTIHDIKRLFKRNAEVAVGGRIDQFKDSFFPLTLDEVLPDDVREGSAFGSGDGEGVLQKLKDRKDEPGILERGPIPQTTEDELSRMYFVYSLNDTEWSSFLSTYLDDFPSILNDDKLLNCFGQHRNTFTEKVYVS